MKTKFIGSLAIIATLSACADPATIARVSDSRAGFATVVDRSLSAQIGKPVWHQSSAEIAASEASSRAKLEGNTISADTAVQVALLNNRGLQAAYAELGLSAVEVWEASLGPVPTVGVSVSGLASDVSRTLEATLISSLLDAATTKPRTRVAELRFQKAQLAAAVKSVDLAVQTRRAWIEAVAAFEAASLIAQTKNTADAASELAVQLGRTGAMNAADQAREHAFTAEIAAELADAKLEAQLAKERLARLMGVSLGQVTFFVPDALPGIPGRPRSRADIERLALEQRADIAAGWLELQAIAADYRLTGETRAVSDFAIRAGLEAETRTGNTEMTPVIEVEFEIPLYDTRKLASRRGGLEYLKAVNLLADTAANARTEARAAHLEVTGKHDVARHWRDVILPLRRKIDDEALKSYNGMITSTFELIEDARDGLEAHLGAAEAKRDYWLAETNVTAAIWGGTASAGKSDGDDE
jgi:outer membrane protein TolC